MTKSEKTIKVENPFVIFKEQQKQLANKIREDHFEWDSWEYRHNHIAYCELRGRTRSEIEIPRDGNEPSESKINSIKKMWLPKIEAWREYVEALRHSE